jgi:hypothetical protein
MNYDLTNEDLMDALDSGFVTALGMRSGQPTVLNARQEAMRLRRRQCQLRRGLDD